ncbi:MAG TPA: hypothetical protein VN970_09890 [Thermoanaerobaculia bacterium]|nr:hypothetical protein [Thermoanaerobaculia bacterium]
MVGGAITLLALGEPASGQIEPPPRVDVIAHLRGEIFNDPPERDQRALQLYIAKAFADRAGLKFPGVEWQAPGVRNPRGARSSRAAAAVLEVNLVEHIGRFAGSLIMSLAATISESTPPMSHCKEWKVQDLDYPYVFDIEQLHKTIDKNLEEHFSKDEEFESGLKTDFIQQIPLADRIEVDTVHQRLILPVDAALLRLADGSRLRVELAAPFCRGNPERCTLVLAYRGPVYGKAFHGQTQAELIERRDCCTSATWTPELASQIARRVPRSLRIYLEAEHRHCPYVWPCGSSSGLFRHPGAP